MKIGVVSDTHMPRRGAELPQALIKSFKTCDLILHLGDWTSLEVYEQLSRLAPVDGIAGNNDGAEIIRRFGYQKVLELGSRRIGLIHGHLPNVWKSAEQNARMAFAGKPLDAVLFGHSHKPFIERQDGLLLFNPGSPTDKRREARYSFGLLELGTDGIQARHVFIDSKK